MWMYVLVFFIGAVSCLMGLSLLAYISEKKSSNKNVSKVAVQKPVKITSYDNHIDLSFDEILTIVKVICDEITINKYIFLYDLDNLNFIKIEEELPKIVNEIVDSLSSQIFSQAEKYVTKRYFIQMITRNIEIILIQWLQKNKPNVG